MSLEMLREPQEPRKDVAFRFTFTKQIEEHFLDLGIGPDKSRYIIHPLQKFLEAAANPSCQVEAIGLTEMYEPEPENTSVLPLVNVYTYWNSMQFSMRNRTARIPAEVSVLRDTWEELPNPEEGIEYMFRCFTADYGKKDFAVVEDFKTYLTTRVSNDPLMGIPERLLGVACTGDLRREL